MVKNNIVKHVLSELFKKLESEGIRYCVLHSYETLPEVLISDVDIAIEKRGLERIDSILYQLANSHGLKIIQKLYYDVPACYYYVLAFWENVSVPKFIQLDFLNDEFGINKYFLGSEILLYKRRRYKNFYIPSASVEAAYLTIKKVTKRKFPKTTFKKLRKLYQEDNQGFEQLILKYFGRNNLVSLKELISSKTEGRGEILKKLYLSLMFRYYLPRPQKLFLKVLWLIRRLVTRIINPTGLIMCFLAPDGAGKSTIAKQILTHLRQGFRRTLYIHWRPGVLPPPRRVLNPKKWEKMTNDITVAPHKVPPQNLFISLIRFFYYTLDYIVGYCFKLKIAKIKTGLVVIDRYYYDFLFDLRRFRLNMPKWLPKLLLPIIPKPDMIVYLHNTPEELYKRKQELTLQELKRQVNEYQKMWSKLPNAHQINTNKPIDEIVSEIVSLILEKKATQTLSLLNID